MKILLLCAAAVVASAFWWVRRRPVTGMSTDELRDVVVTAYARDWANRFGTTAEHLREALAVGGDDLLVRRIDREVGVVDLRLEGTRGHGAVATTVAVTYDGSQERSTAKLSLPWDNVPGTVRAALIRDNTAPVLRHWRAVA